MRRHVLIFGIAGGLLIATLQYTEYRFVVIEHSVELYAALVAILFAAFGIWLGLTHHAQTGNDRREIVRETVVVKAVLRGPVRPFVPNTTRQQTLGITPRELEILTLVAPRLEQSRDRHAAFRFGKHGQDTLCARIR